MSGSQQADASSPEASSSKAQPEAVEMRTLQSAEASTSPPPPAKDASASVADRPPSPKGKDKEEQSAPSAAAVAAPSSEGAAAAGRNSLTIQREDEPSPPAISADVGPAGSGGESSADGVAAAEGDAGPSTSAATGAAGNDGTVCDITLLLGSGARHPYRLDEKYLVKRGVALPGVTESGKKDPFSISVYTLKELILREWREEWENKPSSPSSIRLIYFGKLLDDKLNLKGMDRYAIGGFIFRQ